MGVRIPIEDLELATLQRVAEEFVTREATDYGIEVPFERKVEQVIAQLRSGEAALLFDEALGTTNIVSAQELPR